MRKVFFPLISSALLAASLTALSSPSASGESTLITCTDLNKQKTVVLKANQKSCKPLHATAIWRTQHSDSTAHSGPGYASLRTCTSKRTQFDYLLLRSKCAKHQNTNDYWRTVKPLGIPIITTASARGYDTVAFALGATTQNMDAPVAYYLITNIKTGQINKVSPNNLGELSLSNLSPLTSYTFTIAAVSVDGTSLSSSITPVITTGAVPVVEVAPTTAQLAVPAFTLSSSSETATVNTSATGFTISSTGGAIATFAISATPSGMSFSTSTGALTGTPTSVASATSYTITATNASGSATRTFTLTVTAVSCANGGTCTVGNTGPGGGVIFYVANTPFMCGPTRTATCSYLEAAPSGWNTGSDPTRTWAQSTPVNYQRTSVTGTGTGIGWGYRNTRAIIQQGNSDTATSAAALADSHTVTVSGVVYDDWYLPSRDELTQMCKWAKGNAWISDDTLCSAGTLNTGGAAGFVGGHYWSSSEWDPNGARYQNFNSGNRSVDDKASAYYVRPVRAF